MRKRDWIRMVARKLHASDNRGGKTWRQLTPTERDILMSWATKVAETHYAEGYTPTDAAYDEISSA